VTELVEAEPKQEKLVKASLQELSIPELAALLVVRQVQQLDLRRTLPALAQRAYKYIRDYGVKPPNLPSCRIRVRCHVRLASSGARRRTLREVNHVFQRGWG